MTRGGCLSIYIPYIRRSAMTDRADNRVKEAPQTFKAAGEVAPLVPRSGEYRAKVFKSGNSLALRLPKALGLKEGTEMDIQVNPDATWTVRRPQPPRTGIDVSGFWGKAPGAVPPPREDFEERPSTIAARLRGEVA